MGIIYFPKIGRFLAFIYRNTYLSEMKRLIHIIAICLLFTITTTCCKQNERGNKDDELRFDSIFSALLGQDPAKAYELTDSLLGVASDSSQYYYILSYQAISRLAQNSDVKSFFAQSKKIESFLHRNPNDSLQTKWRVTMRNTLKYKGFSYHHQKMTDSSMYYLAQVPRYELSNQIPLAYLNLADAYNQSGQYVKGAEMSRHAMQANDSFIIRKTKRYGFLERSVHFCKTKRTCEYPHFSKKIDRLRRWLEYIRTALECSPNAVRFFCFRFSFCRFAPALALCAYASSFNDLNAATLSALTILPRKARRDPIPACAFEASKIAFAYDTPPYAYALLNPR